MLNVSIAELSAQRALNVDALGASSVMLASAGAKRKRYVAQLDDASSNAALEIEFSVPIYLHAIEAVESSSDNFNVALWNDVAQMAVMQDEVSLLQSDYAQLTEAIDEAYKGDAERAAASRIEARAYDTEPVRIRSISFSMASPGTRDLTRDERSGDTTSYWWLMLIAICCLCCCLSLILVMLFLRRRRESNEVMPIHDLIVIGDEDESAHFHNESQNTLLSVKLDDASAIDTGPSIWAVNDDQAVLEEDEQEKKRSLKK